MKVRLLLVASLFMAMFAVASVSNVSAAPGVVTDLKAGISGGGGPYPFVHGTAEYKVRAGGGSSFAISIQGAQALRFQKLYIFGAGQFIPSSPVLVCTLHIGANGNGSCYIDTRFGEIVPTFSQGSSEVAVFTESDPFAPGGIAFGLF